MERWTALLPLVLITRVAYAQIFAGPLSGLSFAGSTVLCDQTLDDANATGVYTWNPDVAQFQQEGQPDNDSGSTLPVQWAATVTETSNVNNASVQWSLWYSTLGANYSYDVGLGYDVCAFAIETTSEDFLFRAQDDNGDCTTAMDANCVSDIESQAKEYAYNAVIDPNDLTIRSNLSANSIYDVCEEVRLKLLANFPQSCEIFFNDTYPLNISGSGLTGFVMSTESFSSESKYLLTVLRDTTNNVYHNIATYTKYTLDNPSIANEWYAILNWFAIPALLIFLPVANSDSPGTITEAKSNLQCIRAYHVNEGSEKPPPAPQPTPLHGGLSGGAIAGIVIGVLAGVALIAGIGFFFWRRRKQSPKLQTFDATERRDAGSPVGLKEEEVSMDRSAEHKVPVEAAADRPVKELSPDTEVARPGSELKPAELHAQDAVVEKEAEPSPVELSADVASNKQ